MIDFEKCKYADSCVYDICVPEFCNEYEVARMTNGDRIRAMTDEEIICACAKLPICPPKTVSDCEFHCTSCWREYIQQPYKRDAE